MRSGVPDLKSEMAADAGRAVSAQFQPRVAILMGTFQDERFLAQQLDSIRAQTCSDWAIWVSDDRSSDATLSILESYQAKWGRHKLSIQSGPAQGFRANFLSLACNTAIPADYFAFCD